MIIGRSFYQGSTIDIAKRLLGQVLVRETAEGITRGIITETEAYLGEIDDAAHSYHGFSDRVRVQYGEKGLAYIYMIYGMHHCMNITCGPAGKPEAILIRALQPIDGLELMEKRRNGQPLLNLCSGPGKLCRAMDIDMGLYGADLCSARSGLYLEYGHPPEGIKATPRINIDYAKNTKDMPWRFIIDGSKFLSK